MQSPQMEFEFFLNVLVGYLEEADGFLLSVVAPHIIGRRMSEAAEIFNSMTSIARQERIYGTQEINMNAKMLGRLACRIRNNIDISEDLRKLLGAAVWLFDCIREIIDALLEFSEKRELNEIPDYVIAQLPHAR